MKISLFTSNQPRHIALIKSLSEIASELYVVQECNTIFPGEVSDFYKKSEVMQSYFKKMLASEKEIFGISSFLPSNVRSFSIKTGDLSKVELSTLEPALNSDYYIVFGSSFIKGKLCDYLISNGAINIHMGVSPYYKGTACNFWALYDGNPHLVGATIHLLSKGLDSGNILFHALPPREEVEAFNFGMLAVKSAHEGLVSAIKNNELKSATTYPQDSSKLVRYSKNKEFTDEIANSYLKNMPSKEEIYSKVKDLDRELYIKPFII